MAATWDRFLPYIQPYLPGCPEITIETHLREAAADFCSRSEVWEFDLDPDFTSRNTADYEIDVPTGAVLENILFLSIGGVTATRVSSKYIDNTLGAKGAPGKYSVYQDTSIRMYPTPDGKYEFSGTAILRPSLTATGVEDFIFERYAREISCGAIYRLAEIPGKEWSNPDVALYHKMMFHKGADDAKNRATQRSNLRVAAVGFDGTARRRRV